MKTKPQGGSPTRQKQAQPFLASPQSGRGRAELLQALWLAEQHAQAEDGLAWAAGYVRLPDEEANNTPEKQDLGQHPNKTPALLQNDEAPALTSSQTNNLSQANHSANMRARFWALSERQQLLPSPTVDEAKAKLPLRLEEVIHTGGQPSGAKIPIVHAARLMPAAKRNLPCNRYAGLDIAQLIANLSQAKTLRRLPRKKMLGWTERLLVVLDISEPLGLYRQDMFALVGHLQRWIGTEKLQIRIIEDERYPAGRWLDWKDKTKPAQAPDWSRLGSAWPILFISELGLYANDSGHCKRAWAALLQMLRRQGAAVQVWCPLPLGEAVKVEKAGEAGDSESRILPMVPVVHWSAASRMRPQPLPTGELHRSVARLQLAEEFCTLLANCSYIEPQLVRRMRSVLGAAALDAGIEQLLWQHPALSPHPHARCLRAAKLDEYRQRFSDLLPTQKRQALHIMHSLHMQHNPLLAHVETLTWAAQVGEETYLAENALAENTLVETAQTVLAQLAYLPWQLQEIQAEDILSFMQRFVYGADLRTRQFCSVSMSKMLAVLPREKGGDEAMRNSLPGIREADLAQALGGVQPVAPYWLAVDAENGCLRLFSKPPARQFLLLAEPLMLASVAIELAGKVRREFVQPPRDIAVARLPWGEEEAIIEGERSFRASPPVVDGPIYLEVGNQRLKIEEIQRPNWALEWGRDREGLYALMPDPWLAPRKLHFPTWLTAQQIYVNSIQTKQGRKSRQAELIQLQLACDEIGPFAEFTIRAANGEHSQMLRYIPPGQFLMGSPESELKHETNESPQHQVTISQGFWLADTTCTQGLWQAIMGENPSRFNQENHGSSLHPVENISWDEVQVFLQKLAKLLPACQPALPTEAEWEYACRAGTTTPFSFGATISAEQVNYDGNFPYGDGGKGEYRAHTVAVKELPANIWGLYQMHGNVWEWCADAPREYSVDTVVDPGLGVEVDVKSLRVLRGGGWFNGARFARSAFRNHFQPDGRGGSIGFRFVLRSSRLASRV